MTIAHWLPAGQVNGDSFLVDRPRPTVWANGLAPGRACGATGASSTASATPSNLPYNSLGRRGWTLAPEGDNRLAGFRGTLSAAELDQILGRAAAEPMAPTATSLPRCQTGESPEQPFFCLTRQNRDPANSDSRREPPSPTQTNTLNP